MKLHQVDQDRSLSVCWIRGSSMRRRRDRRWLLPIMLWASLNGRDGPAQTNSLPPALEDRGVPSSPGDRPAPPGAEGQGALSLPLAPQPIPGPAGTGLPVGGMDAQMPQGLPINLATALQ